MNAAVQNQCNYEASLAFAVAFPGMMTPGVGPVFASAAGLYAVNAMTSDETDAKVKSARLKESLGLTRSQPGESIEMTDFKMSP
jgi:hypothetical protein